MIEKDPNEISSMVMIRKTDKNGNHYYYAKSKDVKVDFANSVTFLYPFNANDGTIGYRMVIRKGNKENA